MDEGRCKLRRMCVGRYVYMCARVFSFLSQPALCSSGGWWGVCGWSCSLLVCLTSPSAPEPCACACACAHTGIRIRYHHSRRIFRAKHHCVVSATHKRKPLIGCAHREDSYARMHVEVLTFAAVSAYSNSKTYTQARAWIDRSATLPAYTNTLNTYPKPKTHTASANTALSGVLARTSHGRAALLLSSGYSCMVEAVFLEARTRGQGIRMRARVCVCVCSMGMRAHGCMPRDVRRGGGGGSGGGRAEGAQV